MNNMQLAHLICNNLPVLQGDDPRSTIDYSLVVGGEDEGDSLLLIQTGHNIEKIRSTFRIQIGCWFICKYKTRL